MSDRFTAMIREAGRCVSCGLCLPVCPTYNETGSEADSPRGRIALIRAVLADELPASERFFEHLDLCLGCRACEAACPNQVPYGRILAAARTVRKRKALAERITLFFAARPEFFSVLWRRLRPVKSLFAKFGRAGKIARAFPFMAPPPPGFYPAAGESAGTVGLFTGCISRQGDAEALRAAIHVLNLLGYGVRVPEKQGCCGALFRQAGEEGDFLRFDAFAGLTHILFVGSGCGAELREQGLPAMDVSEFLAASPNWERVNISPLRARIAVHEPCSLRNILRSEAHPYRLLAKIPGATVFPLPGNEKCCGGAGSYLLREAEMADKLAADKMKAWASVSADFLATSNLGCALALKTGIDEERVLHPVVIVARQTGFPNEHRQAD